MLSNETLANSFTIKGHKHMIGGGGGYGGGGIVKLDGEGGEGK